MDKKLAQVIYGSFKRLGKFPVDPSSYFETWADLDNYLKNDPTAYPGQLLVVYNDNSDGDSDKNGLYITFEGIDNSFKVSRVSQSEELAAEVKILVNRFEKQDELIESIQNEYATKEEMANKIDELLGFGISDKVDHVTNVVKVHQENIENLNNAVNLLDNKINFFESGDTKTISLEIDSAQSEDSDGQYFQSVTSEQSIKSGDVIQSIRIVTANDISEPEDYSEFSVYLALDGVKYKELVEGETFYPDIDDEPVINVSFKNPGETYIFDIDYEVPSISDDTDNPEGSEDSSTDNSTDEELEVTNKFTNELAITKEFRIKVDIAGPARCKGKIYINYFKKA